jgi:hypothetical protein
MHLSTFRDYWGRHAQWNVVAASLAASDNNHRSADADERAAACFACHEPARRARSAARAAPRCLLSRRGLHRRSARRFVALENSLQIELMAAATRFPRIAPQALREISRDLQAKLLSYRLRNFGKIQHSDFDAPQLAFPTREIARALGDCIVDDHELQSGVIPLLEERDEDARVRRTTTFEAVVVEAALLFCHEKKKRDWAYVAEFATVANAILEGRGEQIELEPRAVGDILRSVGLFTRRLGRAGRGVLLVNEIRQKIHELAWRFRVLSIEDGVDRCGFCTEARAQFGDSICTGT